MKKKKYDPLWIPIGTRRYEAEISNSLGEILGVAKGDDYLQLVDEVLHRAKRLKRVRGSGIKVKYYRIQEIREDMNNDTQFLSKEEELSLMGGNKRKTKTRRGFRKKTSSDKVHAE